MEKGPEDRKRNVHFKHTEKKLDVGDFLLLKSINDILCISYSSSQVSNCVLYASVAAQAINNLPAVAGAHFRAKLFFVAQGRGQLSVNVKQLARSGGHA